MVGNRRYRSFPGRDGGQQRRLLVLVFALAAALVLAAGFYLGQRAAWSGRGLDPERYRAMQLELPAAQEQVAALQAELDVRLTRHEVDKQALQMLRGDLAAQKEQIAGLEEGLRFYRSLMAPGEIAQGLSLRPLELVAREEPGRYGFRLVAQQGAVKHSLLKGRLQAEVVGALAGEQVSYPLAQLSEDLDDEAVTLRFRYFQSIEGELVLPPGFEPQAVRVEASASEPRKMAVETRFPWQLQEKFTHVGK